MSETEESILTKIDKAAPASLQQFDAFPKLPSTYKARSESRGFLTIFVALLSFFLVLNDIGEWIWGWPDYEFSVDRDPSSYMNVNLDMMVNMPCQWLSVDIRDAVGDRLYLSNAFTRDGTVFDIGQATALKAHSDNLSARQAVAQSRKSRGFFSTIFRSTKPKFRPTYNYKPDGSACRVFGSMTVKKVTANLHITTVGHGYSSNVHVDHSQMNLSHVINEFSFGPYFPDITQPLDYSLEITDHHFVSYQYYLNIVPTTYIAPRSKPLKTNQYSVTHYTRVLEEHTATPGIFFKFDLEPLSLTIHQRTTTLLQFFIRCVGVIGGVWCCMGWTIRVGYKVVEVASGADKTPGIVAAESSSVKKKWGGGELRSRVSRQGSGWVVEGGSPYGSYVNTPVGSSFAPSPAMSPNLNAHGAPYSPALNGTYGGGAVGLGISSPTFGPGLTNSRFPPSPAPGTPSFPTAATMGSPYAGYPPSPNLGSGSFPPSPMPGSPAFAAQQLAGPAPSAPPRGRNVSNGETKKAD
ncbi:DUF1692-domain-containing protein [Rickenella mellea]|uniref:DUF1692-domain-containing protein n=1 Tax=Rickenella mellea TaxID=50990 RepID=A0A4Y7QDR9_9AGAM|nr:DUF1692-domain-containing protein [Rickenella mellea]